MGKVIVILGTLDTKGKEFKFIKDIIEAQGLETIVIDSGVKGKPYFKPDVSSEEVALAGGENLQDLVEKNNRGHAINVMMKGAAKIVGALYAQGELDGIISLGGSAGTTIGTYAMQTLPVGVPKVMVSTLASGDTRPYVDVKDITMMYSVVDISGINSLSSKILSNAAHAISGMSKGHTPKPKDEKPLIGATMFGVTTPCVTTAREYLEEHGYEVLVFHATGTGGKAMESLIESGFIKGVLDITTTEWCDELVGGVLSAGPNRLEAAARAGIPQVVSTGALDMVNFGPIDTVPEKFKGRNIYKHNATVTLMRTTSKECQDLGRIISEKLNQSQGKTALFLPLKGVSLIDVKGQPFYGPKEDRTLFTELKNRIDKQKIELVEMDTDINSEEFAIAMAKKLIEFMKDNPEEV
ncbi:Tm-1-like ATP-binding domain-containing protein [Wukongibacter baidiensis]|uniref:Tm-1-like ATP-binding domain-containing protein n=1 Tax=Wukongibacter baidiensis TaxID=1723361 RepID=UPI003D7FF0E1